MIKLKLFCKNTMICLLSSFVIALIAWSFASALYWTILFFVLGIVFNVIIFYNSDKILEQLFSPRIVSPASAKDIYVLLNRLSNKAGIDLPLLYVSNSRQPNICSLISKKGNKIIFSPSLLKLLDAGEIHAMLAYQVSLISSGVARHHSYLACVASMPLFILHLGILFPSFGGHSSNVIPDAGRYISAPLSWLGNFIAFIGVNRKNLFEIDRRAIALGAKTYSYANGLNKLTIARDKIKDNNLSVLRALSPIYNVALYSSKLSVDNPVNARIQELIGHAEIKKVSVKSSRKTVSRTAKGKRVKRPGIASGPKRSRAS